MHMFDLLVILILEIIVVVPIYSIDFRLLLRTQDVSDLCNLRSTSEGKVVWKLFSINILKLILRISILHYDLNVHLLKPNPYTHLLHLMPSFYRPRSRLE